MVWLTVACGLRCATETVCEGDVCWVKLCGGTFEMGGDGAPDELPRHSVAVPTFQLMRTEVTVATYRACQEAGRCGPLPERPLCHAGAPSDVVGCLDWQAADAVCGWLGGRLPTEAEWEFAATSRGTRRNPWGDADASCDLARIGCKSPCDGALGKPCAIAAGNSAQGICDLVGNAIEWVEDGYHRGYEGAPVDGSAWAGGVEGQHVLRGSGVGSCAPPRATDRVGHAPDFEYGGSGARCAR